MAGTTRLELATSAVTGQRSNQLNYVPAMLRATGGGFDSGPSQCNQFMSTISRSRKVDNRSSIRRMGQLCEAGPGVSAVTGQERFHGSGGEAERCRPVLTTGPSGTCSGSDGFSPVHSYYLKFIVALL
jgi:hypothetical protein